MIPARYLISISDEEKHVAHSDSISSLVYAGSVLLSEARERSVAAEALGSAVTW